MADSWSRVKPPWPALWKSTWATTFGRPLEAGFTIVTAHAVTGAFNHADNRIVAGGRIPASGLNIQMWKVTLIAE